MTPKKSVSRKQGTSKERAPKASAKTTASKRASKKAPAATEDHRHEKDHLCEEVCWIKERICSRKRIRCTFYRFYYLYFYFQSEGYRCSQEQSHFQYHSDL